MEMKKFNEFCKQIILESHKTKAKSKVIKQTKTKRKSKVIKQADIVNDYIEHLQKVDVNGKSYDVMFIEFPNGLWNYQLNQKYEKDCDIQDPSCDVWYPNLAEVEFEQNFNSFEDAQRNAMADIQNQINWGKIL